MLTITYPDKVTLAHTPTPLQPLRRLQADTGGPLIWLKRDDMTGSTLSGNKVRKLEFIAAKAINNNFTALVTCGGIQSNHCRATALVAAQLGLRCHLILRGEPIDGAVADGNLLLNELSGCSISYHSSAYYNTNLSELFRLTENQLQAEGHRVFNVPTGGSNGDGIWGYIAAAEELCRDFCHYGIHPQSIIVATGSGGTQAGLMTGMSCFDSSISVYGVNVCDDASYFSSKIQQDITDWHSKYPLEAEPFNCGELLKARVNIIEGYVGDGYAIANAAVLATISRMSRLEGVVFDPVYTGKAFHGLLSEIKKGRFLDQKDLVFVHTGGLFGLFPFAKQLASSH
tara:strand:- start:65 stop:1090 length:1026 start_codon:yes stop_codon:yes gene_type:complete